MKAITILQPYAALIAAGIKEFETRSWDTPYRGPIAIHSGKGKPYERGAEFYMRAEKLLGKSMDELPKGDIIAIADLVDCYLVCGNAAGEKWMETKASLNPDGTPKRDENGHRIGWKELQMPSEQEQYFGNYGVGFYAWKLENVRPLKNPVTFRGNQRIWDVPEEIAARIQEQEGETEK